MQYLCARQSFVSGQLHDVGAQVVARGRGERSQAARSVISRAVVSTDQSVWRRRCATTGSDTGHTTRTRVEQWLCALVGRAGACSERRRRRRGRVVVPCLRRHARVVVHHLYVRLVEASREVLLRQREADGVADALAERTLEARRPGESPFTST